MKCDGCGKDFERLWRYEWYNGVIVNRKDYCRACIKADKAPPLGQLRRIGGRRTEMVHVMLEMGAEVTAQSEHDARALAYHVERATGLSTRIKAPRSEAQDREGVSK